jgi:hypothetical protein
MPLLSILFWAFFASYVVHIMDETLLNGGFVQWIAKNFWPTYHFKMFFWFNAAFITAVAVGNILFDCLGGHWVIIPLIFVAGFVTHAFTFHIFWTIRLKTYSPGLVTSLLYVVIFYLLIKFGLNGNLIGVADFTIGTVIGVLTLGAFLTIGPTVLFPRIMRK